MHGETKITVVASLLGELLLRWAGDDLIAIKLPSTPPPSSPDLQREAGDDWRDILNLGGIELRLAWASPFRRRIWTEAARIPFGEVRSYGWVAAETGNPRAARAVGGALHSNPLPLLIPCHRVVCSDGTIGGFGSGIAWKKFLLDIEKKLSSNV